MIYVSTRGKARPLPFSGALSKSLAEDGGLYVPDCFPKLETADVPADWRLAAKALLEPFLGGDALEPALAGICDRAFDFPVPLVGLKNQTSVLELFHGPTAAFKDAGARFLAECVSALGGEPRTVLVATSGDTGGAVAAAFHRKPGAEVIVLFPKGRISPRQEKQLTTWGDNIRAFAVEGDFDDCQRIVKEAFRDPWWASQKKLLSANSINLGRLLPQMVYYAAASRAYLEETGCPAGFIIPSGNLGNSVAAFWAKRLGFPIREIVLATNANRAVADYFDSGSYRPRPTVATLANAMDVGDPSNMERLRHLYPDFEALKRDASAAAVSDDEITRAIAAGPVDWGQVWCPHTAAAVCLREKQAGPHWVIVATAHPAKFESIVEPLIGRALEVPPGLAAILSKRSQVTVIAPRLEALRAQVSG